MTTKGPRYFWEVYIFIAALGIIVTAYSVGYSDGVKAERNSWVQLNFKGDGK